MKTTMIGLVLIMCFQFLGYSALHAEGPSDNDANDVAACWITTLHFPVFIFEESQEHVMPELLGLVGNQQILSFNLNRFELFMSDYMPNVLKNFNFAEIEKRLNFIVYCEGHCFEDITRKAMELDQLFGGRSLLRHFSTWLFVTNQSAVGLDLNNIILDHVTVVSQNRNHAKTGMGDTMFYPTIYTLRWTKTGREWSGIDLGNISKANMRKSLFPNTKYGLNARMLTLVSLEWRPFTIRKNTSLGIEYVGATVEGVVELAARFNFSYRFIEPADGKWGEKLKNGSWTGILGVIQREEADLCPCPFGYNYERFKNLDISTALVTSGYTAIYKRRLDDASHWFHFIYPFKWEVYVTMFAALVWVTILAVCLRLARYRSEELARVCFSYCVCIPFRQEPLYKPVEFSSRLLFTTWWLFCVIVAATYSGNLVAFAAVQRIQAPFKSLDDLANQNQYDIGVDLGTFIIRRFKNSNDSTFTKLLQKINKTPIPDGYAEGLEYHYSRLSTDNYILLTTLVDWKIFEKEICHIERAKATFFPFHLGYPFPKNSPLLKLFDHELAEYKDRGLFTLWLKRWLPKAKPCSQRQYHRTPTLETEHLYTVLVIVGAGIFLSFAILLIERTVNERK